MTQNETSTTPISVLILEDNVALLYLLRDGLAYSGYDVAIATSGKEGLRILQSKTWKPHLILCDLQLSDMTACDVLRVAHEDELLREIPVIILSGSTYSKCHCPGFEPQIKAQLVKPVILDDLITVIEKTVANRSDAY
jgi:CheY-like chemotaxis protein